MPINALVGSALIGAASGLGSSLLNYLGMKETNKTNKSIASDTNQANLELYNMQVENQLEQWYRENSYNTPVMQSSRMRQAGLNPALLNGSNPTGVASAASSSMPSAQPMQGYQYQSPLTAFSDLPQNLALAGQAYKDFQEGENVRLGNQYVNQEKIKQLAYADAQIGYMLQQTKKGSMEYQVLMAQKRMIQLEYKLNSEIFDTRKQSFDLTNELTRSQISSNREQSKMFASQSALNDSENELKKLNIKFRPIEFKLAVESTMSRIALESSQSAVNYKQAANIYYDTLGKCLDNKGKALQNVIYEVTAPYVIHSAIRNGIMENLTIESMRKNIRQQGSDYWNPFRYAGQLLGGSGAQAVKMFAK